MTITIEPTSIAPAHPRWLWPAVQVLVVFLLLAAVLWEVWRFWPLAHEGRDVLRAIAIAATAVLVAVMLYRDGANLNTLGLAPSRWRRGIPPLAIATAVCLLLMVAVAQLLHPPLKTNLSPSWLAEYTAGVIAQQLLLQGFLVSRLSDLVSDLHPSRRVGTTVVCSALLFALLHAPNPGLMIFAALAGTLWCWHFLRYHNLLAVIVSHLLLGIAAMILLGHGPLLSLRVGYPALRRLLGP